ncbi:MAG: hypothetical protein AAF799_43050 [Myxococcota bacterium]
MPVSVMGHHDLMAGYHQYPVERRVQVELDSDAKWLRVRGPRYAGSRRVEPGECRPGAVLRVDVKPKPARIDFPCAPPDLTVACTHCPGLSEPRIFTAKDFPPLRMSSFSETVEVVFRAPGYRKQTRTFRVHPGHNKVEVSLEPLPGTEPTHGH